MPKASRIAVLGAGSWGTALACVLARNGHTVTLWGRDPAHVAILRETGVNQRYLPDHPLSAGVSPTDDLTHALADAELVLIAVPSHAFNDILLAIKNTPGGPHDVLWATKGFEREGARLLHDVVADLLGGRGDMGVLSGPTFAAEVMAELPTAVTLASRSEAFANRAAGLFHGERFRVYTSSDLVGVQVGGAVKNVLAIAAGIADGLKLGANSRAALVSRGLAELVRLGRALGGEVETFMGLTGLGDLVLTCTDDLSRNRRFGFALARGRSIEQAQADLGQVVEGFVTTQEVMRLAERLAVDMPISRQVYAVLYQKSDPMRAVDALLSREFRAEIG